MRYMYSFTKTVITLALFLIMCQNASAHDFYFGGIYYRIISVLNKTVGVTYKGDAENEYDEEYTGAISIPSSVTTQFGTTYSVTEIDTLAFYGCQGLTSITIPNSVTKIGNGAFLFCNALKTIFIPNSVTEIGHDAFYDCIRLNEVNITDLSAWCKIDFAYHGSNPLSYAHHLYLNGSEIKDLVIPNDITQIKKYAFYGCQGLTSITIPNSVTSIGDATFTNCTGLTGELTIPNSVTSIGFGAFGGCNGLTSVIIPKSVTEIGVHAFASCSGLTEVTIPNSVTSIGEGAFSDCSGLTTIVVESNNTKYDSRDNCNAIIETSSNTLIAGCKNTTIPNSVYSIGNYAFCGCSGLTSVNIPNSVTKIGNFAFTGCTGLTNITIPNSVTSIGIGAFNVCSLEAVTSYCETPPTCGDYAFYDSYSAILKVPEGTKDAYANAPEWKKFTNIQEIAGVEDVEVDINAVEVGRYDIHGHQLSEPTKGVNIIKMSDGSIRKELMK